MPNTPTQPPTHVATDRSTVDPMPPTTTPPAPAGVHTPIRRFRYGPEEKWNRFLAEAKARGTTGSAILVARVDEYLDECEANPVDQP